MSLSLGQLAIHLIGALIAGGIIGMERSFHGRPAGFRTHALVALSSSMLMLVTLYQNLWFSTVSETIRMDPTRIAQGIMTGIGFLGAGVIFKDGLTVRGLTTAASIWTTAAIGILIGAGLYGAATLATVLTVGVLSVFREIEVHFPSQVYARNVVRFRREAAVSESDLRRLMADHGFDVLNLTYQLLDRDQVFEYRMAVRTVDPANFSRLAETLRASESVRGFSVSPSGD